MGTVGATCCSFMPSFAPQSIQSRVAGGRRMLSMENTALGDCANGITPRQLDRTAFHPEMWGAGRRPAMMQPTGARVSSGLPRVTRSICGLSHIQRRRNRQERTAALANVEQRDLDRNGGSHVLQFHRVRRAAVETIPGPERLEVIACSLKRSPPEVQASWVRVWTYTDLERPPFCHSLPAPATAAAAPRSAIVAGSGTVAFLSLSTFGGFSALGFPEFPLPCEASAGGAGISIPRIATRPNDFNSFIIPPQLSALTRTPHQQKLNPCRELADGHFYRWFCC